jgi:hypothetical protein
VLRGSVGRRVVAWGLAVAVAAGILVPVTQTISAQRADAFTGSDFDPGYIISDALFYDGGAMSSGDIQAFLESKVGGCGNSNCLRNAVVNPPSYGASVSASTGNLICSAVAGGSMRVSEWIYRVQAACGISAKVILVTLQKEQGLVTDSAPGAGQLLGAMGQACPDTAPCDSAFAGLATQIYTGTKQLKIYKADRFLRQVGTYWIGYSTKSTTNAAPNPPNECGGTWIAIRDYATAALYNYTPYQPDGPALANLYGTGGGCSAYGNRNFWRYYFTWFGDPKGGDPAWVEAAFQDLLGHSSGDAANSPQNGALKSGWSRSDVAVSIMAGDEYRTRVITQTYQRVLGRQPDSAGLGWWLGQTGSGAIKASQLSGQFLTSDELYLRAGNTPQGWVALVYESVLGRAPDPGGLASWSSTLASAGRASVYSSIYNSAESVSRRINLLYQVYLGHGADAGAIAYYAPTLGGGDEALAAQLIGSQEYDLRAAMRYPGGSAAGAANPPENQAPTELTPSAAVSTSDPPFLNALSKDLLGGTAGADTIASWSASLGSGLSHTWLAAATYQSAAYRGRIVAAAYQSVLGRTADSGGLNYWVGQSAPGGSTLPSAVVNALLASDEYVLDVGNSTPAWVAGVSQKLLGRAPTGQEQSTWTNIAATSGRAAMISSIYSSTESANRRVDALTRALLGRPATAADRSAYSSTLAVSGDEYVGAQLIGSPAYDTAAQSRFPSPFLRAIGTDLLGADPGAGYIASWSSMLATGTTHYALAGLLYGSTEHRTIEITKAYQSVLGRDPDSAGLSYWLGKTSDGSTRASTMREQFLLSDELYARAGGTPEGWVTMLFQTVLGRTPDAGGLAYWSGQVRSQGRGPVLWGIYNSPESAIQRLNVMTVQLLGRPMTNDDIIGLGPLMVSGGEEAVGAAIIGSRDYDQHAATRF